MMKKENSNLFLEFAVSGITKLKNSFRTLSVIPYNPTLKRCPKERISGFSLLSGKTKPLLPSIDILSSASDSELSMLFFMNSRAPSANALWSCNAFSTLSISFCSFNFYGCSNFRNLRCNFLIWEFKTAHRLHIMNVARLIFTFLNSFLQIWQK